MKHQIILFWKPFRFLLVLSFLIPGTSPAQNPSWLIYNTSNSGLVSDSVSAIAIDHQANRWFGTWRGVSKYDGINWTTYTRSNSGLASDTVYGIAIDSLGNIWFATGQGLSKLSGSTWTTFTTDSGLGGNRVLVVKAEGNNTIWCGTNAGVSKYNGTTWTNYGTLQGAGNFVVSIAFQSNGLKWFGTNWRINGNPVGGLYGFDGSTWTPYTPSNSGLPDVDVFGIAIDTTSTKWLATFGGGGARFDGTNWTVYNPSNSGIADSICFDVAIDGEGTKWFATFGGGVSKFTGTAWTTYDSTNSDLPSNFVYRVVIDRHNNKWFSTFHGVAVFNESGVVAVEERASPLAPREFALMQNYPNPFNPITTFEFSVPYPVHVTLKVFDVLGRQIATIVSQQLEAGTFVVHWTPSDLTSGIYFYQLQAGQLTETKKLILLR